MREIFLLTQCTLWWLMKKGEQVMWVSILMSTVRLRLLFIKVWIKIFKIKMECKKAQKAQKSKSLKIMAGLKKKLNF